MPPAREVHNAKARRSIGGSRKKGKLKKQKKDTSNDDDPNAEIVVPKSAQQKERDRREQLRELRAQSDNWNSKKKKRLEKYIDKKLKQEERVSIFQKLAKSQAGIDPTLLQSSSTLGTGRTITHKERVENEENIEVLHAMRNRLKRKRRSGIMEMVDDSEDSGGLDSDTPASSSMSQRESIRVQVISENHSQSSTHEIMVDTPSLLPTASPIVGSALRRNMDGTVAVPSVRAGSKKNGIAKWKSRRLLRDTRDDVSDTSFDSSDSAYDSDGNESEHDKEAANDTSDESEGCAEENEEEEDDQVESTSLEPKKRNFKEWAIKQLSLAKSYIAEPTAISEQPNINAGSPAKRIRMDNSENLRGPLGEVLSFPGTSFAKQVLKENNFATGKTFFPSFITIHRPPEVEEARLMLPIVTEEQPIMEAIMLNPVVIICGETGSGKTTQVPQFLYEAGFGHPNSENPGMIGITQPRRVAAISMANRVSHELSLTASQVSYQIRYDATVSPSTSIKFMTDGVLLRELATDFLLNKYSVIIIDEAHERSINTDILIGVLSRVIKLREGMWKEGKAKPLRLIIMSATLRVNDFAENKNLFSIPPPIINVAARQHPVTTHFSRRTSPDYVNEAIKKASKIHARLPPGGILIFLTGQNEIVGTCKRLEEKYGRKVIQRKKGQRLVHLGKDRQPLNEELRTAINPSQVEIEAEDIDVDVVDDTRTGLDTEEDHTIDEISSDDLESDLDEQANTVLGVDTEECEIPMHIVPLYSLLPNEKQLEVFKPPPSDSRLVVVATNVAETSLTIPGIKYVIDCGRAKERKYDAANGIQAFQINWISKASAAQRAGRAGRTGPGHCYRLYSSALYEHHFQQFNPPEILRAPIEGIVLQMKNMHIDAVINFPFPTPPERNALQQAEKILLHLGALKKPSTSIGPVISQITDLGRTMALFPLSPRHSRMLAVGQQHDCLPYVIAIVSAMSVGDPFLYEEVIGAADENGTGSEEEGLPHLSGEAARVKEVKRLRRKAFFQSHHNHASLGDHTSDILKILSVVGAFEYHGGGTRFCSDHFVRIKAMEEIHKLRAQISNIMQLYFSGINTGFMPKLLPPNKIQLKVLKQLITAAFIDQVAVRKDLVDNHISSGSQYSNTHGVAYRALGITEDVIIHPTSVVSNRPPPSYVVFQEVVRTSNVYLKGITVVNPAWLSSLGKSTLCTYSKPFRRNDGVLMTIPRFGPEGWELPPVKAENLTT